MSPVERIPVHPDLGAHRFGVHLLLDMWGCRVDILGDGDALVALVRRAADAAGGTVIDVVVHSFGAPWGVTAVAVLAESHLSIHTWPEERYVAVDAYTCGRSMSPSAAAAVFQDALHPTQVREHTIDRGRRDVDDT